MESGCRRWNFNCLPQVLAWLFINYRGVTQISQGSCLPILNNRFDSISYRSLGEYLKVLTLLNTALNNVHVLLLNLAQQQQSIFFICGIFNNFFSSALLTSLILTTITLNHHVVSTTMQTM
mgnify:CR=1 FL=1